MRLESISVACPDCDSAIDHDFPTGGSTDGDADRPTDWGDVPDPLVGADVDCERCGKDVGIYVLHP